MQIDHVSIPVADVAAARAFYEQALAPLGAQVVVERPGAVIFGGGQGQGLVGVRQGTEYRGPVHVALSTDRAGVDAFHEAALAAGGTDNGAPGGTRFRTELLRRLRPRSGRKQHRGGLPHGIGRQQPEAFRTPLRIGLVYSKSSTMKLALQKGEIDMAYRSFTPTEITTGRSSPTRAGA
jgi:catechol 2,3-dioxygenase-like lactoylglutathione lyase family enzyme